MRHIEHELQVSICQYLDVALPAGYRYFAVPNGGRRDIREAARLKKEGVKPGVPDICVVSRDGNVAFLEVKRPKKWRFSEGQEDWRDWCSANLIPWAIVTSLSDVQSTLTAWGIPLKLKLV